ncbi:MAG: iron transporter [Desulfobacteraceae bacterium]|nr:MAG: iron transporter [Desulfobacteraceae bacterium]
MTTVPESIPARVKSSVITGLHKGWTGWLWLLKIIVPVSFATALLVHFGVIYRMDFIFNPVMNLIGLSSEAVLPIIIGLFTGIYGAVAAMAVIPLSMAHMTLIAVFLLISHNLIQESIVQGRSGIHPVFAALFRLFMSFCVTFVCSKIMGATSGSPEAVAAVTLVHTPVPFTAMFMDWGMDILRLAAKILLIIMPLMVVLDLAKSFSVIEYITRLASPLLKLMGLSRPTGMLWLTASVFGLSYGAAVIVEEARSHNYSRDELIRLHLSVGINHAMVEDPALFLPLGVSAVWLWLPRLIAAIAATHIFFLISFARRLYVKHAYHKKLCNH